MIGMKVRLGVKNLIMLCEMVRQDPDKTVDTFIEILREEILKNRAM